MDAIATPFVQGRLKNRRLEATVRTDCACCGKTIEIDVDSDLGMRVRSPGAEPLVSMPFVSLRRLGDRSIIDDF